MEAIVEWGETKVERRECKKKARKMEAKIKALEKKFKEQEKICTREMEEPRLLEKQYEDVLVSQT